MSIRGIDTQLMVNRTMDLSKDVHAMNRRETVAQEQFAQQLKAATEEQQEQVQTVEEPEGGRIRNDEKPREDRHQQKGGGRQEADMDDLREEVALDASLQPGEDDSGMRIDIRV